MPPPTFTKPTGQTSKLRPSLPKAIFWTFSIFLTIFLAQNIVTRPTETIQLLTLLILFALIYKKPQFGLYIIIFLPVVGELLRYPQGTANGVLLSDLFIPLFLIAWLANMFFKNPTYDLKGAPAPLRSPAPAISLNSHKPQRRAAPLRFIPKITLPLLIFIIVAALSLLQALLYLSPQEVASSSLYLIRFTEYTLLFLATHQILTPPKLATLKATPPTPKTIITLLTISALLLAIAGFIQLGVFPDMASLEEEGWDPHLNRLVSTWLDPNFVGGLFAFMISILLGITLHLKKISQKIGLITIIIILATALFLTYSRSAYVAAAVGLTIVSLLKSRKILIIALILFIIGITVSDRARERTEELATSATSIIFNTAENPDPTARLRLKSWEQTYELFQKRPIFGSGYNTLRYVNHYEGYVKDPNTHSAGGSDSSMLTILATTGILGFIPFITIYIILIITAFKNWRAAAKSATHTHTPIATTHPNYLTGYNLGFMAATFALLTHSIFVNSLLFPQIMIFFWISAALTPKV